MISTLQTRKQRSRLTCPISQSCDWITSLYNPNLLPGALPGLSWSRQSQIAIPPCLVSAMGFRPAWPEGD